MAALWELPVIYINENNQYGMGTSVERASAMSELFRRGESFGIKGFEVDGMDPLSVNYNVKKITEEVRKKAQPVLIEAKTYRYRGHSMSDPGKYRTREEVQETRENRDPIERIRSIILAKNFFTEAELSNWDKEIRTEVSEAAEEATKKKGRLQRIMKRNIGAAKALDAFWCVYMHTLMHVLSLIHI
mgnify:CR=1 FL=1